VVLPIRKSNNFLYDSWLDGGHSYLGHISNIE